MPSSVLQIRVEDSLKQRANDIYSRLGLDLPTAIRMFLRRSIQVNGVPFPMVLSNRSATAIEAIEAAKRISQFAKERGISDMTLEEINAEIAAVRNGETE